MSENDPLAPGDERLYANTVRRSKTVNGGRGERHLGLAQSLWPNTLNLADATAGKPGSVSDAASAAFNGNNPFVHFGVRLTPVVSTGPLGQVDSLSLSFTPAFEVVASYLQGHTQKNVLYSLQHHLGDDNESASALHG